MGVSESGDSCELCFFDYLLRPTSSLGFVFNLRRWGVWIGLFGVRLLLPECGEAVCLCFLKVSTLRFEQWWWVAGVEAVSRTVDRFDVGAVHEF